MRRAALIALLFFLPFFTKAQNAVGQWQEHSSFVSAHTIQATPSRVYAATRMAIFYYDRSRDISVPLTKADGLTDMGISTFAYDEKSQCLVIGYSSSNIDICFGNQVYNVADIRYSRISGDKQIYQIRFHDGKAYLATGFGIVVLDLDRHEIAETYYLGTDGKYGTVYDIAFTDSLIYAATPNGLLFAPSASNRLHIYQTWQHDTHSPIAGMCVKHLDVAEGCLVAAASGDNPDISHAFLLHQNGEWSRLGDGTLQSLRCHDGHIVLNRHDQVDIYDTLCHLVRTLNDLPLYGVNFWDADIDADGTLWLGHTWGSLLSLAPGETTPNPHSPSGPFNDDYVYSLTATSNCLYLCPGGKKPTYESAFLPGNISFFDGKGWSQLQAGNITDEYQDILNVAIDPKDRHHISAAAWGHGILDIHDGVLQEFFSQANTPALTAYSSGDFTHLRVAGLAYDKQGNLWITNSLVDNGLVVRYRSGEWASFNISPLMQGITGEKREIDKIIYDSINGYKWFAGRANRIYVHDGESHLAYVNPNNGSRLETHAVTCIAQDRSGDIWIGTDKGIKVIYDGYRAFSNGGNGEQSPCTCNNILYNEDGINEYLMAYESITCIAVDGANRKWVGTANNGLYLISANGLEQLHHFTTANSPLASDKIATLAVHPSTGMLYVGTEKGLQSYRATATAADSYPAADIHAFPNPVRPDYDGPIAIKGFTRDALVHVTDARGHVVFSTTANGGQAIWNGRTLDGNRVASGTYFVFASDNAGNMRSVAKILIIR